MGDFDPSGWTLLLGFRLIGLFWLLPPLKIPYRIWLSSWTLLEASVPTDLLRILPFCAYPHLVVDMVRFFSPAKVIPLALGPPMGTFYHWISEFGSAISVSLKSVGRKTLPFPGSLADIEIWSNSGYIISSFWLLNKRFIVTPAQLRVDTGELCLRLVEIFLEELFLRLEVGLIGETGSAFTEPWCVGLISYWFNAIIKATFVRLVCTCYLLTLTSFFFAIDLFKKNSMIVMSLQIFLNTMTLIIAIKIWIPCIKRNQARIRYRIVDQLGLHTNSQL